MAWPTESAPNTANASNELAIKQRDEAIEKWLNLESQLGLIKGEEMEARKYVTALLFPNPVKGTQRFPLNNGFAMKLVYKLNYTLGDKDKRDAENNVIPVNVQIEDVMNAIEEIGNEGAFLVDRLIKTKYELSESEYKKLDESNPTQKKIKQLLDNIITTTPGAPSLEMEEPKKK